MIEGMILFIDVYFFGSKRLMFREVFLVRGRVYIYAHLCTTGNSKRVLVSRMQNRYHLPCQYSFQDHFICDLTVLCVHTQRARAASLNRYLLNEPNLKSILLRFLSFRISKFGLTNENVNYI